MNKLLFSFLLVTFFAVFSCTEDNEVKPLTYTKILSGDVQKVWVVTELIERKVGREDQVFTLSNCELDDRYTFKADEEKSFIIDNGASKCPVPDGEEPEEDVYVEYTWSFVNASAVLTIPIPRIFGNFLIPFIVKEITSDHMVLEVFADQENTISYIVKMNAVEQQ